MLALEKETFWHKTPPTDFPLYLDKQIDLYQIEKEKHSEQRNPSTIDVRSKVKQTAHGLGALICNCVGINPCEELQEAINQ